MIQAAGINTTPSALQQAWSKAFNDYASTVPGHWHQSMREFQQIATTYPQFKAVSQFLQYATQQAKTEKQTQEANSPASSSTPANNTAPASSIPVIGSLNPTYLIIGGVVVLIILIGGGMAISRRRKPAVAASTPTSYGAAPANPPGPSQPYPGQNPSTFIPQTPPYQAPSAYPPPNYGIRSGQSSQPIGPRPPAGYGPQAALPSTPQPGNRSPQQPVSGGMAAFGAPPMPTTPRSAAGTPDTDATVLARPGTPAPQWRTWPCGHVNRDDARFCRTCGESSPPPPIVRRVE